MDIAHTSSYTVRHRPRWWRRHPWFVDVWSDGIAGYSSMGSHPRAKFRTQAEAHKWAQDVIEAQYRARVGYAAESFTYTARQETTAPPTEPPNPIVDVGRNR